MITIYTAPKLGGIISPFTEKLDIYMKMAGIPHDAVAKFPGREAPKGKIPYIRRDDGQLMGDSVLIIEYLEKQYNVRLDDWLTAEQKAQGLILQRMLDEHLYWILVYGLFMGSNSKEVDKLVRRDLSFFVFHLGWRPYVRTYHKLLKHQGIGRHTEAEILGLGKKDIEALSLFLGDKTYALGDKVSSTDAYLYPYARRFMGPYVPFFPALSEYAQSFQNLRRYCERMREQYGPK